MKKLICLFFGHKLKEYMTKSHYPSSENGRSRVAIRKFNGCERCYAIFNRSIEIKNEDFLDFKK
jgi:hypothetical protein